MNRKPAPAVPSVQQLEEELKREKYRGRYKRLLRGTVSTVLVVIAAVVLLSNLLLPVLRIYGSSMTPTLANGNIVAALRYGSYDRGDIVAFYYNNQILVKRIIALPGETVDIDEEGNVSIDGELLDEPYLVEKVFRRVRHRAAIPGAGGAIFRHGRQPGRVQRFTKQPGRLRGRGAGGREADIQTLAAGCIGYD